jgi:hypothetical protein
MASDEGAHRGEGFRLVALAVVNACIVGSSSLQFEETDCHTSLSLGSSLLLLWRSRLRGSMWVRLEVGTVRGCFRSGGRCSCGTGRCLPGLGRSPSGFGRSSRWSRSILAVVSSCKLGQRLG